MIFALLHLQSSFRGSVLEKIWEQMFLSATELRYQCKKPSEGQAPPKAKNLVMGGGFRWHSSSFSRSARPPYNSSHSGISFFDHLRTVTSWLLSHQRFTFKRSITLVPCLKSILFFKYSWLSLTLWYHLPVDRSLSRSPLVILATVYLIRGTMRLDLSFFVSHFLNTAHDSHILLQWANG